MNSENNSIEDAKLNSAGQQAIREMVRALPEEPLSMAWRSSLNEQLLVVAAKQQKKKRIMWFARPAAGGLSLAMCFALVMLFHSSAPKPAVVPSQTIESAILNDHHTSVLLGEVSNTGLSMNEVTSEANPSDPEDGQWTEADVESL